MDLGRIVDTLARTGIVSGTAGGVTGDAVAGAQLSQRNRKPAGTLLELGGPAAVGGLAWRADQHCQSQRAETPGGGEIRAPLPHAQDGGFSVSGDGSGAVLLIRAMISAAMADGHISRNARARIFRRLSTMELRDDEKRLIFAELRRPATPEALAMEARDPETRMDLYTASLLAIDASCRAGRVYLENLAELLALPPRLVRRVHAEAAGESRSAPGRNQAA